MFIFLTDFWNRNQSKEKAFQRSFDSRENRFCFRVERSNVDRSYSRKISSRDIGKKLVANHGGVFFIPLVAFKYSPTTVRQRFERHCFIGKLALFCDLSDSFLFAIGEKADLNIGQFQRVEPFKNPIVKNIRVVTFQGAVDVQ